MCNRLNKFWCAYGLLAKCRINTIWWYEPSLLINLLWGTLSKAFLKCVKITDNSCWGAKVPRHFRSRERKFQRMKVPGSGSSTYGTFATSAPGSESTRERKFHNSHKLQQVSKIHSNNSCSCQVLEHNLRCMQLLADITLQWRSQS